MQKSTEATWRPTWWMPVVIALVFLFIVGIILMLASDEPFGQVLVIATIIMGIILYGMDQRAKYRHFRELYLKEQPDPEVGPAEKP